MKRKILYKAAFSVFLVYISYDLCLSQDKISNNNTHTLENKSSEYQVQTKRYIKKGDRLLKKGDALDALHYYHKAYELDSSDFVLNHKIGICFLKLNQYSKAIRFLVLASRQSDNENINNGYYLARAYHLAFCFSDAIQEYKKYEQTLQDSNEIKKIERLIMQCQNGIQMYKHEHDVEITNMGSKINSSYPDYGMVILPDETMLFTSRRDNTIGGERNKTDNAYFEDIYVSYCSFGQRKHAGNSGVVFNSESNDAIIGFNKHLNKLFVYKDKGNGDIYIATRKKKKWSQLEPFSDVINSRFQETSLTIANDGNEVFFVSNRNSETGKDIYHATRNENGRWNMPHNLGNAINTSYDEEFVFLSEDNKKLYFSSKGHNTIGGYDIFVSELDKSGHWSTPLNVGAPINTPADDIFYCRYGSRAFYATIKENGNGDLDIYEINYSPKPVKMKTDTIYVEIRDTVYAENSARQSETNRTNNINHPTLNETNATATDFPTIHFATSEYELLPQHLDALQHVIEYLQNNQAHGLQITGHSDNTGSLYYNVRLSKKRANTVADYFIEQGISKTRLKCYGLANLLPVADNQSESNRQKNRRVSFTIFTTEAH